MKIYKKDVENKVKKIKERFPNLEISINGRSKIVYINNVPFFYEEIIMLDLSKFRAPSTWGF